VAQEKGPLSDLENKYSDDHCSKEAVLSIKVTNSGRKARCATVTNGLCVYMKVGTFVYVQKLTPLEK